MKPVIKAVFAIACVSAIGLGLTAAATSQPARNPDKQQIAEASDGDGETNDDAQSGRAAASQLAVTHTAPAQIAETKDQPDSETTEAPGGDGDGETNDDG